MCDRVTLHFLTNSAESHIRALHWTVEIVLALALNHLDQTRRYIVVNPSPADPRLSRRTLLIGGLGSVGAAFSFPQAPAIIASEHRTASPGCTLSGEVTEGPYYVDRRLVRTDITEGCPGVPLRLRVTVLDVNRCAPVRNAAVDLWHCDASGVYSGYTKAKLMGPPGGRGPGGPPPSGPWRDLNGPPRREPFTHGPGERPPHQELTDNKTFFRGVQITNEEGIAEFVTIFPGWYMGRAIHIHMKVWVNGSVADRRYAGGYTCHTGQLFFPEDLTEDISRLAPYRDHKIQRIAADDDHIFSEAGPNCIAKLSASSRRSLADGLIATAMIGVNPMIDRSIGT